MSNAAENQAVVLEYVDAFNRGDVDGVCRLFTPDALVWGVLGWGKMEVVRPVWRDLVERLQMKFQVESMVAEGDVVAVRYTERGTSVKSFRGQGPTGNSYEVVAMEFFELRERLIHRRWGARDSANIARQLGFAQV
jgi:predicted ester cyclase